MYSLNPKIGNHTLIFFTFGFAVYKIKVEDFIDVYFEFCYYLQF